MATIAGLVVTLSGFTFTIIAVLRSKRAAQAAANAAEKTRELLSRSETIADFSAAVTIMEEIKRLHRAKAWLILPDRYTILRRKLISILSASPDLSEQDRISIQSAIQHFIVIEERVEKAVSGDGAPPNVAKLNKIVGSQIDNLEAVLTSIRHKIGV